MDVAPDVNALVAVIAAGVAVGAAFGAVAERSGFCTMGAVADVVLFGGWRRARLWAAAIATAAFLLQGWAWLGGFTPSATLAARAPALWLAGAGGLLFGAGMVVAGGCLSRAWVRAGAGSAKALATIAAAAAAIVLTARWTPAARDAPGLVLPPAAGVVVAVALFAWILRDGRFRRADGPLAVGVAVGALIALAHGVTAPVASDGLRFVQPVVDLAGGRAPAATAGLALIVGTALGAAASAWRAGRWRLEPWVDAGDVLRHLAGGVAMGVGGTLALGCTVGAGITGTAAMAPAPWLALAGMVAGATAALKLMLAGGPAGAWRALRRTWARRA